jgi:hypothetical protein
LWWRIVAAFVARSRCRQSSRHGHDGAWRVVGHCGRRGVRDLDDEAVVVSEIAELKKQIARLEKSVELLQAFVDSETRRRKGLTVDAIRDIWHGRPPAPPFGPV